MTHVDALLSHQIISQPNDKIPSAPEALPLCTAPCMLYCCVPPLACCTAVYCLLCAVLPCAGCLKAPAASPSSYICYPGGPGALSSHQAFSGQTSTKVLQHSVPRGLMPLLLLLLLLPCTASFPCRAPTSRVAPLQRLRATTPSSSSTTGRAAKAQQRFRLRTPAGFNYCLLHRVARGPAVARSLDVWPAGRQQSSSSAAPGQAGCSSSSRATRPASCTATCHNNVTENVTEHVTK
jgi:hypothetical protein